MSSITVTEIIALVIVLVVILSIVVINYHRKQRKESSLSSSELETLTQLRRNINKQNNIEDAMDKLISENPLINTIDEAYQKIPLYYTCSSKEEEEYCRAILHRKYYGGYRRYDDERLR